MGDSLDTSVPQPAFVSRPLGHRWEAIPLAIGMAVAGLALQKPQHQLPNATFPQPTTANLYPPTTPQFRTGPVKFATSPRLFADLVGKRPLSGTPRHDTSTQGTQTKQGPLV